jgi:hypothetical protein
MADVSGNHSLAAGFNVEADEHVLASPYLADQISSMGGLRSKPERAHPLIHLAKRVDLPLVLGPAPQYVRLSYEVLYTCRT